MFKNRPIINVQTLEIFPSLKEAAEKYGCSKVDIHMKCKTFDWRRPFFKTRIKQKEFVYYDEWIEYPDFEKKRLCSWSNVDFFSVDG